MTVHAHAAPMAGRHDGGAGVPRGRALSHIYSGGTGTEPTFGGCRCRVRWVTPNDGGVTRVASSLQISIEAPNLARRDDRCDRTLGSCGGHVAHVYHGCGMSPPCDGETHRGMTWCR